MTILYPAPPAAPAIGTHSAEIRACVQLDLTWGQQTPVPARMYTFHRLADGAEHIAVEIPGTAPVNPPMVRLHSECLTGDVFGSGRCDCGQQLAEAIDTMRVPGGYILYLRQEGRGIGLYNKLDSYRLQDRGRDTFEANRELGFPDDLRDYTAAAQMLETLGATVVRLLSNNPDKQMDLESFGISVSELCRTGVHLTEANAAYLAAKVDQARHTIDLGKEPTR